MTAIVVDSSAWLEMLGGAPLSRACEAELAAAARVLVPTVVLFEVYKKVLGSASEDSALSAVALLSQHELKELTREVALLAADLAVQHRLGMADAFVLAHARSEGATLVTLDNDFAGLPDARVLRAKGR